LTIILNITILVQKQQNKQQKDNEDVIYDIIVKAPDILFVAFGHGKQEKWIHENLVDLPSVKIAMGVGGSFDFISANIRRNPHDSGFSATNFSNIGRYFSGSAA